MSPLWGIVSRGRTKAVGARAAPESPAMQHLEQARLCQAFDRPADGLTVEIQPPGDVALRRPGLVALRVPEQHHPDAPVVGPQARAPAVDEGVQRCPAFPAPVGTPAGGGDLRVDLGGDRGSWVSLERGFEEGPYRAV